MLSRVAWLLFTSFGVIRATYVPSPAAEKETRTLFKDPTCKAIASAVSNASAVFYPGQYYYLKDISHYISSSTQNSLCSVEPGSVQDVATIIRILANSTVPFAVKGAGHASNVGFSSTSGIQIAMYRFSSVVYHEDSQTADIGTGLVWDDVYAALEPHGVNVVGGRVSGVGVAGFTLGGGYSWLTNLHGLTIDTVVGFELVLPSGEIIQVTDNAYPDLFFGLKGGFNNFGIVTKITLRTYPQTQVYAGLLYYDGLKYDEVTAAVAAFAANNTDPNANILPTYDILAGLPFVSVLTFYNAPTAPPGFFDSFTSIPTLLNDVKTRSFSDFVQSAPSNATAGLRGLFNSVALAELTPSILKLIVKEALFYGETALLGGGIFISYDVEPFLKSITSYATPSAFPHSRYASPLNLYFAWPLGLSDDIFLAAIKKSADKIRAQAIAEGQDLDSLATYPNYALGDAPLDSVYKENVPQLQAIKAKYDPTNVMGRAGGFKF